MMKFIFPIFWITIFGGFTFAAWTARLVDNQGVPLAKMKYNLLFGLIMGSLLILLSIARLKRIRVDGHSIYISNYRKEISIPLGAIVDITEYWWFNPTLINIHFRSETEFGNKITFTPQQRRPFLTWGPHPTVVELRRLANI
ncbi:MAG TPA: hypothetical protein VGN55_24250 [Xanthobacteraceae bacterium]